jgi:hypothetical protein
MADTANNIPVWQILPLTDTSMADTANNRYLYGRYCHQQILVWQILPITDTCMEDTAINRCIYGRYCQ